MDKLKLNPGISTPEGILKWMEIYAPEALARLPKNHEERLKLFWKATDGKECVNNKPTENWTLGTDVFRIQLYDNTSKGENREGFLFVPKGSMFRHHIHTKDKETYTRVRGKLRMDGKDYDKMEIKQGESHYIDPVEEDTLIHYNVQMMKKDVQDPNLINYRFVSKAQLKKLNNEEEKL